MPAPTAPGPGSGPSLVARRVALGPDAPGVGFTSFFRPTTGRLWLGAATIGAGDADAREALARALGAIRGLADDRVSPAALLGAVQDELTRDGVPERLIAVLVAALDVTTGELVCARAGGLPPWIVPAGGGAPRRVVVAAGPALGAAADRYIDHVIALAPGDALVWLDGDGDVSAVAAAAREAGAGTLTDAGAAPPTLLVLRHAVPVAARPRHTLALRLASELDAIEAATLLFDAYAAAHHVPDAVRRAFDIAFDDLINNVVSYAYQGEPDHVLDLHVTLDPDGLEALLADDGPAFDPFAQDAPDTELELDDRDIGGLGIHLVRSMMDDARYERVAERNVVTIRKHFTPTTPSQ